MSLLYKASLIITPNGYKEGKLYSVVPNTALGDMDVVRATTATRVNSAGVVETVGLNVPRIDYTVGSCPSLLVEPQRTNLILQSNGFNNTAWNKTNSSITPNAIAAPDGSLTANKLVDNVTINQHRIDQQFTAVIGTYTFSVFIKKAEEHTAFLRIGFLGADFNLINGTTSGQGVGVTSSIQNVGNDWFRCIITRTTTSSNEICSINLRESSLMTYIGNGIDGLYIYGAQLEAGSNATSYIPTVASSVTRNADVISKTGISSLINSQAGTMFIEASALANNTFARFIELNDGTTSSLTNNVYFRYEPTTNLIAFTVFAGGVIQCNIIYSLPLTQIANNKMAFVWSLNRFEIWVNGSKVGQDTLGITPAISTLSKIIFSSRTGTNNFESNLKSLQIYKEALSDSKLAQLTTL